MNLPVHDHTQATRDLSIVAAIGILLQTGVLLFSAYTAYNTRVKNKVGGPGGAYAFPLLASGTILLVIGIIIYSVVIDSNTNEFKWVRAIPDIPQNTSASKPITSEKSAKEKKMKKDTNENMRAFWLQRKHVVGDTSFDSFLIMARGKRSRILNSRCRDASAPSKTIDLVDEISEKDIDGDYDKKDDGCGFGTVLEYLVVIGVFTGLAGFVLQFEGFHGLSWSCSIAQLVAILIMTTLRAFVRRGLLTKPYTKAVPFEHEMDWLALKIGFNDNFFDRDGDIESSHEELESSTPGNAGKELKNRRNYKPNPPSPSSPPNSKWDVVCHSRSPAILGELSLSKISEGRENKDGGQIEEREVEESEVEGSEVEEKLPEVQSGPYGGIETDADRYAKRVVGIRRRLGQLTNWASPASELAISIAKSVEIVMNQFFKDGKEGIFTWSVEVQIAPKRKKSKPNGNSEISWISSKLSFTAEKDSEKIWKTDSTHIEAVLSLWLYRTNKQIRNHTSEVKKDEKNVDWLRSTKSGVTGSFYRVLGPDTKTLRNDMAWVDGGLHQPAVK